MASNNVIYMIRWDDAGDFDNKDVRITSVENGLIMAQSLTSFAGETIREWRSPSSTGEGAGLPELEKGERYHLRIFENESPKKSVLFRITFYDATGTELSSMEMKRKSCDFKYPENADSYSIQAVHNGYKKLFFHHMEICRSEDYITGQLLNANEEKKIVNVLFLDQQQDRLLIPDKEVLSKICNLVVISGTTQPILELQQAEAKLPQTLDRFNKVHFVGMGEGSCDLAKKFAKKYQNAQAYRFEGLAQ